MRVLGKGRKQRIVPFNRTTEAALRAWLEDWGKLIEPRLEAPSPGRDSAGSGLALGEGSVPRTSAAEPNPGPGSRVEPGWRAREPRVPCS